jgi:hypothetical protein
MILRISKMSNYLCETDRRWLAGAWSIRTGPERKAAPQSQQQYWPADVGEDMQVLMSVVSGEGFLAPT